jgi:hypothetical protein
MSEIAKRCQAIKNFNESELDYGTIVLLGKIENEAHDLESKLTALRAELEQVKEESDLRGRTIARVTFERDRVTQERDALKKGVDAVCDLIAESGGVYGLHLNGDGAPWNDLLAGGKYEEWLIDFSSALATVKPGTTQGILGHDEIMDAMADFAKEEKPEMCANCGKPADGNCDCMKNKCIKCGKPVGNITFTYCDTCWKAKLIEQKEGEIK